jgi:tetratricopeptide (TPR) repeat protein
MIADQAIAHDPNFALPYAFKALVYATLLINTSFGPAGDSAQLEPLVRINAERADELEPTGGFGDLASATVEMLHWRWANAQRSYEDYLKGHPAPGNYVLWLLSWSGQPERAIEIQQKAVARDPNNAGVYWYLGLVDLYAGHTDKAVTALQRGIDLAPALSINHELLVWAEIARGHNDDALRELQLSETLIGANNRSIMYLVDLLYCFSRLGREDDVKRLFTEIQTLASQQELGTGGWATVYLATGQRSEALEQLRLGAERARNKVLDPGFLNLMNIRMNLARDPVLEQPEFVEVRKRLQGD